MKKIEMPAVVGPGSQPHESDGAEITFMQMPSDMTTFEAPIIPEPEDIKGLDDAIKLSDKLLQSLQSYQVGSKAIVIELDFLDEKSREFFNHLLGEGEVSVQCGGEISALIQESVLAGVWRVQYVDAARKIIRDTIEVADIPGLVSEMTFQNAVEYIDIEQLNIPDTIYNAPPLLTELSNKLTEHTPANDPHTINLSLLPHSEEDIKFLSDSLGIGPIVILSRGYGNCRISSTKTKNVWWVQYFNSQETLILNTLEISRVPGVACASKEDIEDSASRLDEILSIYR